MFYVTKNNISMFSVCFVCFFLSWAPVPTLCWEFKNKLANRGTLWTVL